MPQHVTPVPPVVIRSCRRPRGDFLVTLHRSGKQVVVHVRHLERSFLLWHRDALVDQTGVSLVLAAAFGGGAIERIGLLYNSIRFGAHFRISPRRLCMNPGAWRSSSSTISSSPLSS